MSTGEPIVGVGVGLVAAAVGVLYDNDGNGGILGE